MAGSEPLRELAEWLVDKKEASRTAAEVANACGNSLAEVWHAKEYAFEEVLQFLERNQGLIRRNIRPPRVSEHGHKEST